MRTACQFEPVQCSTQRLAKLRRLKGESPLEHQWGPSLRTCMLARTLRVTRCLGVGARHADRSVSCPVARRLERFSASYRTSIGDRESLPVAQTRRLNRQVEVEDARFEPRASGRGYRCRYSSSECTIVGATCIAKSYHKLNPPTRGCSVGSNLERRYLKADRSADCGRREEKKW